MKNSQTILSQCVRLHTLFIINSIPAPIGIPHMSFAQNNDMVLHASLEVLCKQLYKGDELFMTSGWVMRMLSHRFGLHI